MVRKYWVPIGTATVAFSCGWRGVGMHKIVVCFWYILSYSIFYNVFCAVCCVCVVVLRALYKLELCFLVCWCVVGRLRGVCGVLNLLVVYRCNCGFWCLWVFLLVAWMIACVACRGVLLL